MALASSSDDAKMFQLKQNVESSIVSAPRTWPAAVTVVSLLAVAGGGIAALIHFSKAITDVAVAYNFIAQNGLSLFVLLAVVAQALIYFSQRNLMGKQWEEMRNQSTQMRTSLMLANRASLSVHSVELNKEDRVVLVTIENTGNMPAQHISLFLKLVSFGPIEGIGTSDLAQEVKSSSVLEDYGRTKLFKGNLPILLTFYLRSKWTDSDFRNIEKGKDGLSLVGYVRYCDGFSDEPDKRTEFYFDYHPEIGKWTAGPPEHGDILGWDDDDANEKA